ncbi:MAG: transposase zinc-binding domain-containing protein, partial [Candidatus Eremiobacterota bacterium]
MLHSFSCKTRICPSCASRRAEDVAEKLSELLPVVTYRHLVFTLPKKMGIRARFRQDRSLFRSTARLVTRLLTRWMRGRLSIQQDTAHAHPGILLAQQSFEDQIKVHP